MTVKKRPSDLTSLERFNLYYREKEDPMPTSEKFKRYIWNPKTKEFCGRSASSWSDAVYILWMASLAFVTAVDLKHHITSNLNFNLTTVSPCHTL
ncbi:hypothetical protein evm_005261 [Chilo suppressalis]|nr:hypothetical protein evm_005261 [Chilo suppressalis]